MDTGNAERYRQEAQRIRLKAETMTSAVIRIEMLGTAAAEYELMAENVELMGRRRSAPDRSSRTH
jgi:hypothetical protein